MIDPQNLVAELADDDRGLPKQAIADALEHRDEVVSHFIGLLTKAADGEAIDDDEKSALFLIVHLLAEMKATEAYEPFLRLLGGDIRMIDEILGEAITETSHKVIISLFDGKTDPLYELMNDPKADEYARDAAFRAWTYFVATDEIEQGEAEDYLIRCADHLLPQSEDYVWTSWLDAIAVLGFENLRPLVQRAFDSGRVMPDTISMKGFDRIVGEAVSGGDREAFLRQHHLEPFTDTIGTLSRWYGYSEAFIRRRRQQRAQDLMADAGTVFNPYKGVGRNEPCPCGSGKKFKKCCLN